jgi:hypothetical protein
MVGVAVSTSFRVRFAAVATVKERGLAERRRRDSSGSKWSGQRLGETLCRLGRGL